ncbi:MAG: twin-arginine translocase subunit TatC [Bacteroidales bacterium]|nr:twin-arginine translocase subunit TatC [Bacteroidales bacterium]
MSSGEMTFWDHLEVLRWSIFRTLGAILILFIAAFAVMPSLFDAVVLAPTTGEFFVYKWLGGIFTGDFKIDIVNINVTAPFFTHMRTAFLLALVVGFPYLLVEVWLFVKPALYKNEKRGMGFAMLAVALLFYIGCAVGYLLVFPLTFRFLAGYHIGTGILTQISLNSYISTFVSIIFIMGLVFELPVLAWVLGKFGLVNKSLLRKYRRYAIVILLILAAVITPTGDPFTLMVVFLPIYLLYEVSILVVPAAAVSE